jgi:glycosyltransferase involved in cell wall biosynthesis
MRIGLDAKRAFHNTSGLGEYSRNLIRALHQHQPTDQLLLYTPSVGQAGEFGHYCHDKPQLQVMEAPLPPLGGYWRTFGLASRLVRDRLDLYHGLSHDLPFSLAKLPAKTVVSIHDLINYRYPENYSWADRWLYDLKLKNAVKQADGIIAISEQTKADVVRFLRVPPDKVRVVYQSVSVLYAQRASEAAKLAIRERYHIHRPFVLNVSSFNERKNQLLLVHAYARIRASVDHDLILVGQGGRAKAKVQAYIDRHQLGRWVRILDQVGFADLPTLYQCADLFVYPSRFEGFGIPIAEAMYARVPVLAARNSSLTEVGGEHCAYFATDDEDDLAEKMRAMLLARPELATVVAANFIHATSRFNLAQFGENTYQVYREILGG